jgi:hypothetical protein
VPSNHLSNSNAHWQEQQQHDFQRRRQVPFLAADNFMAPPLAVAPLFLPSSQAPLPGPRHVGGLLSPSASSLRALVPEPSISPSAPPWTPSRALPSNRFSLQTGTFERQPDPSNSRALRILNAADECYKIANADDQIFNQFYPRIAKGDNSHRHTVLSMPSEPAAAAAGQYSPPAAVGQYSPPAAAGQYSPPAAVDYYAPQASTCNDFPPSFPDADYSHPALDKPDAAAVASSSFTSSLPMHIRGFGYITEENSRILSHPDVMKAFADHFERTRKVGRIFLAADEKVVDVLATQSYAPIWYCFSRAFWSYFCSMCCRTLCFLTTLCINPKWQCKWNLDHENYTHVLVLTNRRLILYKESDGSPSLKRPQRYSHQQIHLSAIGFSVSHYAQALPGIFGRLMMCLCGCCLFCHDYCSTRSLRVARTDLYMHRVASLKFETKFPSPDVPNSGFRNMYAHSKMECSSRTLCPFLGPLRILNIFFAIFALFVFLRFIYNCLKFAIHAAFIQPVTALMELIGLIRPSTDVIIFEELLSEFRDREEHTDHSSGSKDLKRFDSFMKNFNICRSQCFAQEPKDTPPCDASSFEYHQGQTWEQAYDTSVFDNGGLGDRVFVNSHAIGLVAGSESVFDAINITPRITLMDWLKCCLTSGAYFCGVIAPMRALKQFFVFTNHRAIKCVVFSGNNVTGRYGTFNAYTRTVSSWYECMPTKGAKFEVYQRLLCSAGCLPAFCYSCAFCTNPTRACMEISADFGVFKLDTTTFNIVAKKEVFAKVQNIFSHYVRHFECKSPFTADKLGPHVAQHHNLSSRDAVFNAACNQGTNGGIKSMMTPLIDEFEEVHAGVYQYGDWHMSGSAGGAQDCFKKWICPDKFWWHSGLAVTEHKVLAYYNRCTSAERSSDIVITMIPADKIKSSAFYHTAQSFRYKCCECCIPLKNLEGEPVKDPTTGEIKQLSPAEKMESYQYGIMRAEIHLGTGSGSGFNFAANPPPPIPPAVANKMTNPKPMTFFGAELTQHSAQKMKAGCQLPNLSDKEIEMERLYAVMNAVSYIANEKKKDKDKGKQKERPKPAANVLPASKPGFLEEFVFSVNRAVQNASNVTE